VPLGTKEGLGPCHIMIDGDQLPPKGHSPHISAHVCCSQKAGCIKMSLVMEIGIGPDDNVLDGGTRSP